MTTEFLPPRDRLTVHFAHVAYHLAERFARRETGIRHFQTWNVEDTFQRCGEADVLVLSGFWDDAMLDHAARLRFIQVCAAGYERFDLRRVGAARVRMANGRGVNSNAVAEHAMALMLALVRHIHTGRDHQRARHWRGMVSQLDAREDELAGKCLLVYGLGGIGCTPRGARPRLRHARSGHQARHPCMGADGADEVHPPEAFLKPPARGRLRRPHLPLERGHARI